MTQFFLSLAKEPPFRIFARALVKRFAKSIRTKDTWDAVSRPHYLKGVLAAADQANREEVSAISVFEFGVAGGNGLVVLDRYASAVERETGVKIAVYGFDTGTGIPVSSGDFRDHPDQWRQGDYPMDEEALRRRLSDRTSLVIGDIKQTMPKFLRAAQYPPVGFVAIDVDLYSSTVDVLRLLSDSGDRLLRRVPMYFDDVDFFFNHKFAGELLAIDEFNVENSNVKIDQWRGIRKGRAFPECPWLEKMYVAHAIETINNVSLARSPSEDLQLSEAEF